MRLYSRDHLSMSEIAHKLHCSDNKIAYWMDRYQIPRRNREEAIYLKHNPTGDPFKIKKLNTDAKRELLRLGIGLYIGEGTKNKNRVVLTNTNPKVIRTFLRFLREICSVEEKRIYAYLNVFNDADLDQVLNYWQQVTGLRQSQFVKPTVRQSKGGVYRNKSLYGTLTVGVSNTKLAKHINEWCEQALQKFGS